MNKKHAFSLMEMMVILLVVAIGAAATAPMINKKLLTTVAPPTGCLWQNGANGIHSDDNRVFIGTEPSNENANNPNTGLYVFSDDEKPQIALRNNTGDVFMQYRNRTFSLSSVNNTTHNIEVITSPNSTEIQQIPNINSIAMGTNAQIAGNNAIALGADANVFGNGAIAIGGKAGAPGAVAIGNNTNNVDDDDDLNDSYNSVALGANSQASGPVSIAIGNSSVASEEHSIAIGSMVSSQATSSTEKFGIAIGARSRVVGKTINDNLHPSDYSIGLGYQAEIEAAPSSIAIGYKSSVKTDNKDYITDNAIAIGKEAKARDKYAIAIGTGSLAYQDRAIAVGAGARSLQEGSIAIGYNSRVASEYDQLLPEEDMLDDEALKVLEPTGRQSIAIGANSRALGENSIAIGGVSDENLTYSHYKDRNVTTAINGSIVIGSNSRGDYYRKEDEVRDVSPIIIGHNINMGTTSEETAKWVKIMKFYEPFIIGNSDVEKVNITCDVFINGNPYGEGKHIYKLSDKRLKDIGEPFKAGLEEIKKLEVYDFIFKKDKKKWPRVGVIAQELQKVFPNAVKEGDDGYLTIRKEDMFYAMVNAVKELSSKLENIRNKDIIALEEQIKTLDSQNSQIEKQNKKLKKHIEKLEKKLAKNNSSANS